MSIYYGPGRHLVKVVSQSFTKAQTGTMQLLLRFTVMHATEPFNDNMMQYERRIYFSLTENTVDRVLAELRSVGSTAMELPDLFDPASPRFYDFTGREIELYCSHEPVYKNPQEMRERWSVRGGERTITDRKELEDLVRTIAARKKTNSGAINTLPAADRDDIDADNDVPF
jgi:hypothetical protein